jgi:hypothetical protein
MEKEETFSQIEDRFTEYFVNVENYGFPNNEITKAYQTKLRDRYNEYKRKYQRALKYDDNAFFGQLANVFDDFKEVIKKLNAERCKGNAAEYNKEEYEKSQRFVIKPV